MLSVSVPAQALQCCACSWGAGKQNCLETGNKPMRDFLLLSLFSGRDGRNKQDERMLACSNVLSIQEHTGLFVKNVRINKCIYICMYV